MKPCMHSYQFLMSLRIKCDKSLWNNKHETIHCAVTDWVSFVVSFVFWWCGTLGNNKIKPPIGIGLRATDCYTTLLSPNWLRTWYRCILNPYAISHVQIAEADGSRDLTRSTFHFWPAGISAVTTQTDHTRSRAQKAAPTGAWIQSSLPSPRLKNRPRDEEGFQPRC